MQQHGWARPDAPNAVPGRCFLFADGLRYKVGQRLAQALAERELTMQQEWRFAALPTVTPTAKPAVSPIAGQLGTGPEFTPTVDASGTKVTIEVLRRVLADQGIGVLKGDDTGTASGAAWTEYGSLDSLGHAEGWKLAHRVAGEVRALAERIVALLDAGWQSVQIVTDHG